MSKKIKITFLNWWGQYGNDIPNAKHRLNIIFSKDLLKII
jgi:hypothetical protein